MIDFSIAISSFNRVDCIKECLSSMIASLDKCQNYEIVVVDNSSRKDIKEYLYSINKSIRVIDNYPVSGGDVSNHNKKFEVCYGKYIYHCCDNNLIINKNKRNWLQDIRDVFNAEQDSKVAVIMNELSTSRVACLQGQINWNCMPKMKIKDVEYAILGTPYTHNFPVMGYTYRKDYFNIIGNFETDNNKLIEYNHIWRYLRRGFKFAVVLNSALTTQITRTRNMRNF